MKKLKYKLDKEHREHRLEVLVSAKQKELLSSLASKYNLSISQVIRAFVDSYLLSGKNIK